MRAFQRLRQAIGASAVVTTCVLVPVADVSVCWFEAGLFRTLVRHAGRPDDRRLEGIGRVEPVTIPAADSTKLSGFILRASSTPSRRLLLFAQGDGTLADEMLASLTKFQSAGYDVFIFDYRGFGRSEGRPSIASIERDYETIIDYMSSKQAGKRFYYGVSGGGVILLRALRKDQGFAGLALDSTPSRMPFFCDSSFFPVNNVPRKATGVLVVQASRDENVPPSDSERLAELVQSRGGRRILIDASHPAPDMLQDLSLRFDVVERHFEKL